MQLINYLLLSLKSNLVPHTKSTTVHSCVNDQAHQIARMHSVPVTAQLEQGEDAKVFFVFFFSEASWMCVGRQVIMQT